MITKISPAVIDWQSLSPRSQEYDDIYFNPDQGIAESRYNFLAANRILERFQDPAHESTVIAETGFGTGLNFLLSAQQWQEYASQNSSLTYISVEKFPLTPADLQTATSQWPELTELVEPLLQQYPTLCSGYHQLYFKHGKIKLILMFGDATECYAQLQAKVDFWYLDGFAPAKNPQMWSTQLFTQIARLSKKGSTFSTFTAAGLVRRGLQEVGFTTQKVKGFGRKREMLIGQFTGPEPVAVSAKPWFNLPKVSKPKEVTVIGAGLAGCTTAFTLAKRGIKVRLIDKEPELASAGSGNPQGVLYAKLPAKPTQQGAFHLAGLFHSLNLLQQENPEQSFWQACGVAQLATSDKELKRQQQTLEGETYPSTLVNLKSQAQIQAITGTPTSHGGLFFPSAGWVSPRDFCQHLTQHKNITFINKELETLEYKGSKWQLQTRDGQDLTASHVVICAAEYSNAFEQTQHLPLKTIRGQVSMLNTSEVADKLKTVVCGEGYIAPPHQGQLCFGATFDLKGKKRNVSAQDHERNLENLSNILPEIGQYLSQIQAQLQGRTAFRCNTPDYMPIVGPAPVYDNYIHNYAKLRQDKKWNFNNAAPSHHPNLYLNTAHGSKGLITCPLSAELIATMLCDEPLPVPKDLIDTVNPSRFIIKNLIKQAI